MIISDALLSFTKCGPRSGLQNKNRNSVYSDELNFITAFTAGFKTSLKGLGF